MAAAGCENNWLIRGGLLLTQDLSLGTLRGDVRIVDGRIDAIGDVAAPPGARIIDATGKVVLPGFVDTHRHNWQGALRLAGLGWDFPTYRQHVQLTWGPRFTPEDTYLGELVGALAALDAGITTLRSESHIQNSPDHADAVVAALRDSGIRAVFAHGWPCRDSDAWMLDSTRTHLRDISRLRTDVLADDTALVTLNAMLRGPDMSTPEVTAHDLALARALGVRSSMHVGWRPGGIAHLRDAGLLDNDLLFVHCCASSDDELQMAADAGAATSVASTVEITMPGLGPPATDRIIATGSRPSLSSDTEVCVAGDMFAAMRAAHAASALHATIHPGDEWALPSATDLLAFATRDGAVAAGLSDRIGTITPGKQADLIMIDLTAPHLAPATEPVQAIVAAATAADVTLVMVAGRVLKDCSLTHRGIGQVYDEARRSREAVMRP
ncbi:amidohydrolase family protein [Mycolicibacterium sp. CBM1]